MTCPLAADMGRKADFADGGHARAPRMGRTEKIYLYQVTRHKTAKDSHYARGWVKLVRAAVNRALVNTWASLAGFLFTFSSPRSHAATHK
jgi:hypothetical protein